MDRENSEEVITNAGRTILPLLCICSFSTLFNLRAISPVLVDISAEFGIAVGVAGTLGAAFSLPAAFMSLFFGPISDRYGRRSLIVLGLIVLIISSVGAMLSPTFTFLLICRILAGLGAAAVSPAVFAAVGDYFPYAGRGRAYGWLVSATTMAVVLGIPAGSLLAGIFTWRWMFGLLSIMFLVVTLIMIFRFPPDRRIPSNQDAGLAQYLSGFRLVFRSRSAIAGLLSTGLFGLFWHGWATYNGAFFIETLGISTESLAPVYTLQGLAILGASQLGGFLSDRFTKKTIAITGMIAAGVVMTILANFGNALWLAIALNTLMAIPAGMRFVSGNALLSELIPSARGTFMSMNASIMEVGSMAGSTLGVFVLGTAGGYGLLGISFGSATVIAALILLFFVVEAGEPGRGDKILSART